MNDPQAAYDVLVLPENLGPYSSRDPNWDVSTPEKRETVINNMIATMASTHPTQKGYRDISKGEFQLYALARERLKKLRYLSVSGAAAIQGTCTLALAALEPDSSGLPLSNPIVRQYVNELGSDVSANAEDLTQADDIDPLIAMSEYACTWLEVAGLRAPWGRSDAKNVFRLPQIGIDMSNGGSPQ